MRFNYPGDVLKLLQATTLNTWHINEVESAAFEKVVFTNGGDYNYNGGGGI
jgi:hypothetical protein